MLVANSPGVRRRHRRAARPKGVPGNQALTGAGKPPLGGVACLRAPVRRLLAIGHTQRLANPRRYVATSAANAGHVRRGVGSVADADLAVGALEVPFDGVDADAECGGDF
jgi:hypothetical protein